MIFSFSLITWQRAYLNGTVIPCALVADIQIRLWSILWYRSFTNVHRRWKLFGKTYRLTTVNSWLPLEQLIRLFFERPYRSVSNRNRNDHSTFSLSDFKPKNRRLWDQSFKKLWIEENIKAKKWNWSEKSNLCGKIRIKSTINKHRSEVLKNWRHLWAWIRCT